MPLMLLIAITGAAMVWSSPLTAWVGTVTGTPRPILLSKPPDGARPLPLELLVKRAEVALPGAETTRITPAATATAPVVIRMKFSRELHPNGTSAVYLDPYSGAVLLVENALRAAPGPRLLNLRYPLHVGRYGGVPVRGLYVVVGLMPGLLFVTGCSMWWRRTRSGRRASRRRGPAEAAANPL